MKLDNSQLQVGTASAAAPPGPSVGTDEMSPGGAEFWLDKKLYSV
jgi:hypothetical protein